MPPGHARCCALFREVPGEHPWPVPRLLVRREAGPPGAPLHIIREDGPKGWAPGKQTMCGQAAWDCRNSGAVILDPLPDRPPEGLAWCPKCIGHLAERLGLLEEIGSSLAAYDSGLVAS